jgi:hypothetical protein
MRKWKWQRKPLWERLFRYSFSADEKRYYSTFLTKSVPKIMSNFINVSVVAASITSLLFILFVVILVVRRVR